MSLTPPSPPDAADVDAANFVAVNEVAAPGPLTQDLRTLRVEASVVVVADDRPPSPAASATVNILEQLLESPCTV